jgi:hypothetical protein
LDDGFSIVGGPWPDHAVVRKGPTDEESTLKGGLASNMLEFILKRADFHETVSVSSIPLEKPNSCAQSAMTMIKVVLEAVVQQPRIGTSCVAYDNGTNFTLINSLLLGKPLSRCLQL